MKISEDYVLAVENIKNKINNLDFSFSKAEITIIKLEEELLASVADVLSKGYENWQTVTIKFCDQIIDDEFNQYLNEKFIINYYKKMIDSKTLNNSFDESGFLSDGAINELEIYFKERLKDKKYQLPVYCMPSSLLKIIIDENRFDMLESIKSISDMYDETALKIREYYLSTGNKVAAILAKFLPKINLPVDHFNLQQYLEIFNYQEFDPNNLDELIKKINEENNIVAIKIDWNVIFKNLNKEQKDLLATTLLNKKYFHPYILSNISVNEDNYEELVSKAIAGIENGIIINRFFVVDLAYVYNSNRILQDRRVVEALVDNGYLSVAVQIPVFKNYEQRAINLVKETPDKFKDINFTNSINLNKYQDLLLELLKINNESAYWLSNGVDKASIFIKEEALKGNLEDIPYFLLSDENFINQMIINGHLEILFSSVNKAKISNKVKLSKEACQQIIDYSQNNIEFAISFVNEHPLMIINSDILLQFFLQINERFVGIILNKIYHTEETHFSCSVDVFYIVKDYLIKNYKLNSEQFEECEKHFGPSIIKYVINENIQKFINLPKEQFDKLIVLFPKVEINMVDIEKVYDSLKQYEFSKIYPDVVGIFANMNHSISDNNNKYLTYLNELISVMDDKFYKKIDESYPSISSIIRENPQSFMLACINSIKIGNVSDKEKYLDILHTITNYYIAYKREKYRDTYNMFGDLNIPYNLDEKDIEKQYIKHYLLNSCREIIIERLCLKGYDEALVSDCIDYYRLNKKDFSDARLVEIKRMIKDLITEAKRLAKVTSISNNLIDIMDSEDLIKRKYYVETSTKDIFAIIANLRIDVLANTLLKDNEKAYNSLLKNMHKYKLHAFPEYFKEFMQTGNIDITLEPVEISGFISYYSEIYEMEKKRLQALGKEEAEINLSIVPIIKYAEAYSSVSSIYNQILGSEDARFIKANPNPNAAVKYTNGNEKLDRAVLFTLNNFRRTDITIPAFNEVITFNATDGKNKNIRVVVGNFTHPSNLTHGERTGSCMRIGGIGYSLFNFCLEDPNGFHIRFEDPETGEYISRVSGFRNGNSVFLNELRYSCNLDHYSNKDVVKACTEVAKRLIDKSIASTCPIDNVFLHDAYATSNLGLEKFSLNINNNKEGLKKFYTDIGDKAIVLASNNEPFERINFDKSNVPTYSLARELSFESMDNGKIRNMINRVHAIKLALDGLNYEYIDSVNFEDGLYYGIANQDWYVYIDNNGNIHEEILNLDSRAIAELEDARKRIMDIKFNNSQEINYGGLKVG